MINKQDTFSFKDETKDIILATTPKSKHLIALENLLDLTLEGKITKPVTTLPTLDKLKTTNIHIINHEKLDDKFDDVIEKISTLKDEAVILLDTFDTKLVNKLVQNVVVKTYVFNQLKTEKEDETLLSLHTDKKEFSELEKGLVIGEAINKAKDLVNTPYSHLNATDLANKAKKLEALDNVYVTILNKKEIKDLNMGAYLGVNKGSLDEPQFIRIDYRPNENKEFTALVGKGVMYDTGGYSLKTPKIMPNMKSDMGGAAAVIASIEAIAKLKGTKNVTVIVPATDNRIGDQAIVPDDVLTSASGKTIEIISTDAEGRLTLADGVWYAQKIGAKRVIDVATLTGSIVRALGHEFTGAFTNSEAFFNEFTDVTKQTNELVWRMPLSEKYNKKLKSKVADMKNTGGALAGASIAGEFIQNFIEKETDWIHLDIAGTAFKEKEGTGVMVHTFTELFL
ncbi:MAG: leucyl aminopeptidase [Candidatus Izimaplasma sp.]|nr:leucyl aminopeptidase [Candidatus Izimaplasma bacterium]